MESDSNPNHATELDALRQENKKLLARLAQLEASKPDKEPLWHDSLKLLTKVAQATPSLISTFLLRPDGTTAIPYASPGIQGLFGSDWKEVAFNAAPVFERVHPDDQAQMLKALRESATHLAPWHHEFRFLHPSKGEIWIEGNSLPERLPDGSTAWYGILSDITARKRSEKELHETKQWLELAHQAAQLGAWEWDIVTNANVWSEGLWRLYNRQPGSSAPSYQLWLESVHPDDRPICEVKLSEAVPSGGTLELEWRVAGSDRWLWSVGRPLRDEAGCVRSYRGIVLDITQRKMAEQRAQQANAALASELEARRHHEQEIQQLTARLLNAQETERARVARDLHDDLSQQIAALGIGVGSLKRYFLDSDVAAKEHSNQLHKKVNALSESVRRISRELHPSLLQYSGLPAALKSYCTEFGEAAGLDISFSSAGSFDNLDPHVSLHVFRIVQEALHNVVKHAQVSSASLQVERSGGELQLIISDNGVGIDANRSHSKPGLGLISMRERTRLLGGQIQIDSAPGNGTAIKVTLENPQVPLNGV